MSSLVEFLRRVGAQPRVVPLTALILRARTVRQPLAFALRELFGRRGCFRYQLRSAPGYHVLVRHGTGDVVTIGEVFYTLDYMPPAEVEALFSESGPRRILDLGANVGYAGAFFADRWPDAQITAYEPDPGNAAVHEALISADGLESRWQLRQAAAGNREAVVEFVAGGAALSRIAAIGRQRGDGEELIAVDVHDVLPEIAEADLLKIDIEGGEWAILGDPRFSEAPPRCLAMEYHPEGCPERDPAATARKLLEQAGLTVHQMWQHDHGAGMVWAWRER